MSSPFRTPGTVDHARTRCLYCGGHKSEQGNACARCGVQMGQVWCAACHAWRVTGEPRCEECNGELPRTAGDGEAACPRCNGELPIVALEGGALRVRSCRRCFGSFLAIHDWSELLDRAERGDRTGLGRFVPPPPGRELPRQALLAEAKCPDCHAPMDRFAFAARSPIVVDVCKMHGLWLDAGEVTAVVAWVRAREENGGTDPVIEPDPNDPIERALELRRHLAGEERAFRDSVTRLQLGVGQPRPVFTPRAGVLAAEIAVRLLLGG